LSTELTMRFPEATLTNRLAVPLAAAASALQRGDAEPTLQLLEPVRRYDHAPSAEFWPPYLRGLTYLRMKDGRAAAAEFQEITDHRGEVPASMFYPLAYLGLARASALSSDTAGAQRAYGQFLSLWKDADTGLGVVGDARRELAALR
jgi:hypothetical protein